MQRKPNCQNTSNNEPYNPYTLNGVLITTDVTENFSGWNDIEDGVT